MRFYRYLIFILCIGQLCLAQNIDTPVQYDDSKIEKQTIKENDLKTYKADDDFNYKEVVAEESFLDKAYRWLNNILRKFWEAIFGVGTCLLYTSDAADE